MAWIELHQAVWTHRKTSDLADALDLRDTYAAAHVARLWSWALDNAPDGILRCSCRTVARAADWDGDPELFVHALEAHGWLDQAGEHYAIHDWDEYAGRLIDRREQDKERKRRSREAAPSIKDPVPVTSVGHPRDGVRTVPNRTQPNTTQPDRKNGHVAADAAVPVADAEPGTDYSREIFEEYRVRIQPKAKFLDDARRKIRARLRNWKPAELRAAIDHFAANAWEMEHNGHRGAAWFFASDPRIEQYVNARPQPAKSGQAGSLNSADMASDPNRFEEDDYYQHLKSIQDAEAAAEEAMHASGR